MKTFGAWPLSEWPVSKATEEKATSSLFVGEKVALLSAQSQRDAKTFDALPLRFEYHKDLKFLGQKIENQQAAKVFGACLASIRVTDMIKRFKLIIHRY